MLLFLHERGKDAVVEMVDGEMWEAKTELQGELELSELCESEANFT